MTIVACYETEKEYWIASDSVASADDFCSEYGPKVFHKNNYIVGFCMSIRAADIVKELNDLPKDIKDTNDFREFRDEVMRGMIEEGGCEPVGKDNDTMSHPLELLVISPYGMWHMGSDYQILWIKEGYYAIGSGEEVAMGSLFNSRVQESEDGLGAVKMAVSSAIKHINSCGGNACILSIDKIKTKPKKKRKPTKKKAV